MGFKIDRREVDAFARRLANIANDEARAATAAALTRTAEVAKELAQRNVRRAFVNRNKWTIGSIKSTRTPKSRPIAKQFTLVGSKQDYLELQERGGALPRTSDGRRITTARGSREGATSFPRRKVATGRYRPSKIRVHRTKRVRGSPGVRAKIAVEMARRQGHKFIFLRLRADNAGIFEVQKRSIRMVHRVMKRRLQVKARPWLKPAVDEARRVAPEVFRRELSRRFRP